MFETLGEMRLNAFLSGYMRGKASSGRRPTQTALEITANQYVRKDAQLSKLPRRAVEEIVQRAVGENRRDD